MGFITYPIPVDFWFTPIEIRKLANSIVRKAIEEGIISKKTHHITFIRKTMEQRLSQFITNFNKGYEKKLRYRKTKSDRIYDYYAIGFLNADRFEELDLGANWLLFGAVRQDDYICISPYQFRVPHGEEIVPALYFEKFINFINLNRSK